jgi:hypothetical protein
MSKRKKRVAQHREKIDTAVQLRIQIKRKINVDYQIKPKAETDDIVF